MRTVPEPTPVGRFSRRRTLLRSLLRERLAAAVHTTVAESEASDGALTALDVVEVVEAYAAALRDAVRR